MDVAINLPSQVIATQEGQSLVICVCARSPSRHNSLLLFDGPEMRLPNNVLYKTA